VSRFACARAGEGLCCLGCGMPRADVAHMLVHDGMSSTQVSCRDEGEEERKQRGRDRLWQVRGG